MIDREQQIEKLTEKLQNNCHQTVEAILKDKPNCSYQDATNVWLFKELAELKLSIAELMIKQP